MHEKKAGEFIKLECCRCDRPIWVKNGINWRFIKNTNAAILTPAEAGEFKAETKEAKPAVHADTRHETKPAGREGREARSPRTGRPPQDNRRGPRPAARTGTGTTRPERRPDNRTAPRSESRAQTPAAAKPEAKPEVKK
jgi:hypothetical protein